MSVQENDYIGIGVLTPYPKYDNDEEREKASDRDDLYSDSAFNGITHYKGLCVISDGMNGEFWFVGRILAKSKVYERLYGPIDFNALSSSVDIEMLAALITNQFGIEKPDIKIWFFTAYR